MSRNTRERCDTIRDCNQRNDDRIAENTALEWLEAHMRQRLAEIRARELPAGAEPYRQMIVDRYEQDLATWVQ